MLIVNFKGKYHFFQGLRTGLNYEPFLCFMGLGIIKCSFDYR